MCVCELLFYFTRGRPLACALLLSNGGVVLQLGTQTPRTHTEAAALVVCVCVCELAGAQPSRVPPIWPVPIGQPASGPDGEQANGRMGKWANGIPRVAAQITVDW